MNCCHMMNADVIKVEDEDYGIWYIDAMERPEIYEGKTVEMRVQVQRSPKMPPGNDHSWT